MKWVKSIKSRVPIWKPDSHGYMYSLYFVLVSFELGQLIKRAANSFMHWGFVHWAMKICLQRVLLSPACIVSKCLFSEIILLPTITFNSRSIFCNKPLNGFASPHFQASQRTLTNQNAVRLAFCYSTKKCCWTTTHFLQKDFLASQHDKCVQKSIFGLPPWILVFRSVRSKSRRNPAPLFKASSSAKI